MSTLDAAARGAWSAGKGVGTIVIQVIAFMSIYMFLDTSLAWLGAKVGLTIDIAVSTVILNTITER